MGNFKDGRYFYATVRMTKKEMEEFTRNKKKVSKRPPKKSKKKVKKKR